MSNLKSSESSPATIKKSGRPEIQKLVDTTTETILQSEPNRNILSVNGQARDSAAARIVRERLQKEVRKAKDAAKTDPLTGLFNRDGFDEILLEEAKRSKKLNQSMVIVILDANQLREINNGEGGHAAGDAYLKKIAEALQESMRSSDIAVRERNSPEPEEQERRNSARWGGDEFGVVLFDTNIEGAKIWWNRASEILAKRDISIGAGSSEIHSEELQNSKDINELIQIKKHEADQAMYKAKALSKQSNTRVMVHADLHLAA